MLLALSQVVPEDQTVDRQHKDRRAFKESAPETIRKPMGLSLRLRAIRSRSPVSHHPEKGCQTSADMQMLGCSCDTLGLTANWM